MILNQHGFGGVILCEFWSCATALEFDVRIGGVKNVILIARRLRIAKSNTFVPARRAAGVDLDLVIQYVKPCEPNFALAQEVESLCDFCCALSKLRIWRPAIRNVKLCEPSLALSQGCQTTGCCAACFCKRTGRFDCECEIM